MSDPSLVWTAVGVMAGIVFGMLGLMLTLMARRETKAQERNDSIKVEITTAIDHLSDVLTAKLESKETVNGISVRLARVEGAMGLQNDAGTRS